RHDRGDGQSSGQAYPPTETGDRFHRAREGESGCISSIDSSRRRKGVGLLMGVRLQIRTRTAATRAPSFTPVRGGLLQRKCACGGCAKCREERVAVQRRAADRTEPYTVPPVV